MKFHFFSQVNFIRSAETSCSRIKSRKMGGCIEILVKINEGRIRGGVFRVGG